MNSSDEIPRGDLVEAMQHLAACNARLCRIAEAADVLAEAAAGVDDPALAHALDNFKIVRNGE